MNLHKIVIITLLSFSAQSLLNAGTLYFDKKEIEALDTESYQLDQDNKLSVAFKNSYKQRENMIDHNQRINLAGAMGAALSSYVGIIAAVLSEAKPVYKYVGLGSCVAIFAYFMCKGFQNSKEIIAMEKSDRINLGKITQTTNIV